MATVLVINTVLPAIANSNNAMVAIGQSVNTRIETQISTVYATAELDSTGTWQDTNGNGLFDVFIWVKNVGSARILDISGMDVFFGQDGNFQRIPYVSNAGGSTPYWSYTIENGTDWAPGSTLAIDISEASALSSGTYFAKIVTDGGASDSITFSF